MKKLITISLFFILLSCSERKDVEITLLVGNKEVVLNKNINPSTLRVVQDDNVYRVEYWNKNDYETIVFYKEPTRILKINFIN